MMSMKPTALLALILMSAAAHGGEIYKWVDKNGQVHYGNSVPKSEAGAAVRLKENINVAPVSDAQRQEAEAKLAKAKASLQKKAPPADPPIPATAASDVVQTSQPDTLYADKKQKCEAEWKRYKESLDCVAPYMTVNGTMKAEALEHCTILTAPGQLCDF